MGQIMPNPKLVNLAISPHVFCLASCLALPAPITCQSHPTYVGHFLWGLEEDAGNWATVKWKRSYLLVPFFSFFLYIRT